MIIDSLSNLKNYLSKDSCCKIEEYLKKLSPDMEEGLYPIDGDNIYAKVMSYPTSPKEKCKIEAHNIYVDIQSTLVGSEGIDVFDRDSLRAATEYDPHNDVVFYEKTVPAYLSVDNQPGRFCMIFPEEAHRPQESVDGCNAVVKKFVIKIKRAILVNAIFFCFLFQDAEAFTRYIF